MTAPPVISRLPEQPGVYRFRDAGGRTLYIGRATRLRRRVRSYWGDLRDRRRLARILHETGIPPTDEFRELGERAGRQRVGSTPEVWQDFMALNAQLAAALRG